MAYKVAIKIVPDPPKLTPGLVYGHRKRFWCERRTEVHNNRATIIAHAYVARHHVVVHYSCLVDYLEGLEYVFKDRAGDGRLVERNEIWKVFEN